MNNKRYILNVGKTLNLKAPEKNWLAVDDISEVETKTEYMVVKMENGTYKLVSSWGGDSDEGNLEFIADQTRRHLGYGKIIARFKPSECKAKAQEIKALTGKSSFSFYVYK